VVVRVITHRATPTAAPTVIHAWLEVPLPVDRSNPDLQAPVAFIDLQGRLLHQAGGFGIEAPQETSISGHLGLKNQRRQIGPLWRRKKQAIEPVFALFEHRRRESVASGIRGQIGQQRQDPIRLVLEEPIKKLVAGDHDGVLWAGASGVGRQPGVEIGHALEIQQRLGKGLQPFQWQAANQAVLLPTQGPAAAAQQAQGDLGFSLDLTQGDASGLTKGDASGFP
jgi:hypothetical protein